MSSCYIKFINILINDKRGALNTSVNGINHVSQNLPVILVFAGRRLPRRGNRPVAALLKQATQTDKICITFLLLFYKNLKIRFCFTWHPRTVGRQLGYFAAQSVHYVEQNVSQTMYRICCLIFIKAFGRQGHSNGHKGECGSTCVNK